MNLIYILITLFSVSCSHNPDTYPKKDYTTYWVMRELPVHCSSEEEVPQSSKFNLKFDSLRQTCHDSIPCLIKNKGHLKYYLMYLGEDIVIAEYFMPPETGENNYFKILKPKDRPSFDYLTLSQALETAKNRILSNIKIVPPATLPGGRMIIEVLNLPE